MLRQSPLHDVLRTQNKVDAGVGVVDPRAAYLVRSTECFVGYPGYYALSYTFCLPLRADNVVLSELQLVRRPFLKLRFGRPTLIG